MRTLVLGFPYELTDDLVHQVRDAAPGFDIVPVPFRDDEQARSARGRGDLMVARAKGRAPMADQRDALAKAEVALLFDLPLDLGLFAPNLRWIQGIGAGLDHWRGARLPQHVVLTNGSGVAAGPIAEFVLARILQITKRLPELDVAQRERGWRPVYGRRVSNLTLGIVGYGSIGQRVGALGHALGMRVLAVRRQPREDPHATVWAASELHRLLCESDVIVVAAPATEDTQQLFDAAAFAAMRPGTIFINVARGSLVDEHALVEALRSGHLGYAAVDVTAHEPLEADAPLRDAPNLLLSAHCSATNDGYVDALYALFCENLRRYASGSELVNVVRTDQPAYE